MNESLKKLEESGYEKHSHDSRLLREKRSKLSNQLTRLRNDIEESNSDLKKAESTILRQADVVFVTLNSSGNEEYNSLKDQISAVFIDESSQARETEVLIPLKYRSEKLILFGDSLQLSPTVLSSKSSKAKFDTSLFERLIINGVKPYFLDIQYRMHPDLSFFPNKTYYFSKLVNSESVIHRPLPKSLGFLSTGLRNIMLNVHNGIE